MTKRIESYRPPGSGTREYETRAERLADKRFYASARWLRLRDLVRCEEPLCRVCYARGEVTATHAIDHVIDRKERPDLALDRENLQGLCRACHNAKRKADR